MPSVCAPESHAGALVLSDKSTGQHDCTWNIPNRGLSHSFLVPLMMIVLPDTYAYSRSQMTAGGSGPDQKSKLTRAVTNAAGRAGHEIDMAATILFLAGRGGTFYTAQTLFPDGGELSRRKLAGLILTRVQARLSLKQRLSKRPCGADCPRRTFSNQLPLSFFFESFQGLELRNTTSNSCSPSKNNVVMGGGDLSLQSSTGANRTLNGSTT